MNVGDRYGPWQLCRPLGEGGAGEVWLCEAEGGRVGALKVLRGQPDKAERARFAREIRALQTLDHEGIVRLLDHGFADERPWLVMEYVEGENLEERLSRGEAFPLGQALEAFARLASGLAHAHAHGIHHRDVKASNVILRPDGRAVLVDFGTAIETDATGVTAAGLVMGTFSYMPPEVLTGGQRDPALGDVYALGQLLHEALTGTLVFRGDPEAGAMSRWNQVVAQKLDADALDPGEGFPAAVRALVCAATQIEPEDRLPTMNDLARRLSGEPPTPSTSATPSTPAPRPRSSGPSPALITLTSTLAGLLTALVVSLLRG